MSARAARLMPNGVPRYIRCYDNGGSTLDRYTVVFTGRYAGKARSWVQFVSMSALPYHPQGIGQHGEMDHQIDTNRFGFAPAIGRTCHLGRRIIFQDLPNDCKCLVISDYQELWGL